MPLKSNFMQMSNKKRSNGTSLVSMFYTWHKNDFSHTNDAWKFEVIQSAFRNFWLVLGS